MEVPGGIEVEVAVDGARQQPGAGIITCVRCGHPVSELAMGCRNPCRNCRHLYPAGDCAD